MGEVPDTPESHVDSDRRRRRRQLIGTSLRAGGRTVGASVRAALTSDQERKTAIRSQARIRSSEDAARTLGDMKGIVMKMAQMASFIAPDMPDEVKSALAQLQQDAPPMTWELASSVMREEMGDEPEVVFASIETEPAAAASIGQVHRAVLDDGLEVAVKVQYPGVDDAIRADLSNAGMLKMIMSRVAPALDLDPIVEEFSARVNEELDYRVEAANQQEFCDAWAGHDAVQIPEVVHELSSRRVIVTEWCEGARFDTRWDLSQDERNATGIALFRYAQRCIHQLGMFNGDPHPGNYLFRPDGRVVFLDFGCVKRLARDDVRRMWRDVATAVVGGDAGATKEALIASGWVTDGDSVPAERLLAYLQPFHEPYKGGPYRFTNAGRSELFERLMSRSSEWEQVQQSMQMPADVFFLFRLESGLGAILSRLEAEADWAEIRAEYFDP